MDAEKMPFKKGMIILWSGSLDSIPKGWALCDGNNGTPYLWDCFILAAGAAISPGDTGGSWDHGHDLKQDNHYHNISGGNDLADGSDADYATGSPHNENTETEEASAIPPYYALAYIMKL